MCLIIRNPDLISTMFISELLLLVLVFIYFVVVLLYLHIFIVVRKSARNLGVRRESRLAKRISVIVLTSLVFFAAPNFSLAWFTFWGGGVFDDARFNRTLLWWLPPVCLVTNACLNPCLFAFKNDKFLKAVRKKRSCPLGLLLRSKPKVKNDQAYHVFGTIDSAFATSLRCVPQEVALTMFSAVEEPRKGISNDALGLDISQTWSKTWFTKMKALAQLFRSWSSFFVRKLFTSGGVLHELRSKHDYSLFSSDPD